MPLLSLPTGKTVYISSYQYYFELREEDIDEFFQTCIADDLGSFIENPFSELRGANKVEDEEIPDEILKELE